MNQNPRPPGILIVDDNPTNIKVLGQALRSEYEISIATNGKKALDIAASENPPDLILLDVMMPEMDGYEVCRRLKANPQTQDIPVIFSTTKSAVEDETKGLELGAVDYIVKPFQIPLVLARVKTHLRLKRKSDLLESLASIDGLTEIPNRRGFEAYYTQEWKRARRGSSPLSIILVDIDYFKEYNDNYGYTAGNDCLKKVVQTMTASLERPGDLVARYSKDRVIAVLPETPREAAETLMERIRVNIERLNISHPHSKISGVVTVSLGAATAIPTKALSREALIEMADVMLRKAKENGRNQYKSGLLE